MTQPGLELLIRKLANDVEQLQLGLKMLNEHLAELMVEADRG